MNKCGFKFLMVLSLTLLSFSESNAVNLRIVRLESDNIMYGSKSINSIYLSQVLEDIMKPSTKQLLPKSKADSKEIVAELVPSIKEKISDVIYDREEFYPIKERVSRFLEVLEEEEASLDLVPLSYLLSSIDGCL